MRSQERGEVELSNEPTNWRERETRLVRDMSSFGVTREITSPITFILDGFAYVKDVFNISGYNSLVNIDVFQFDTEIREYVSYFSGELIMKTCEITDSQIQVLATPSGVASLIKDKGDKVVELDSFQTFTGQWIVNLPKVLINMHSRVINRTQVAVWENERNYNLNTGRLLQIGFDRFDIDEINGWARERATIDSTEVFPLIRAEESGNYIFDVDFYIKSNTDNGDEIDFFYRINQNSPVAVNTSFLVTGGQYYFKVELDESIALNRGDAFYFYGVPNRNFIATLQYQSDRPVSLTADKFNVIAETVGEFVLPFGLPAFECFEQVLKIIAGPRTILSSNALGRETLGYSQDGEAGMNMIVSGAGLASKPENLKVSFNSLFQSFRAMYNLGFDVVRNPDLSYNIVIEPFEFFFSKRLGYTISGVSNFRKRVAQEYIFDEVEVGFQKFESGMPGSLQDSHGRSTYTLPGRFVNQKLQIISDLIGSANFIEKKRRDFDSQNTRTTGDQDVFIVNLTRTESGLVARKNEGFDEVTGISSPETMFNLDIHPDRMLRRWGSYINSVFYKNPGLIRFTQSETLSELSTKKDEELFTSTERSSINSEEFPPARFFPEVYEFDCKLTATQDRELLNHKYDVIEVVDGKERYFGYLLERSRKESNSASFTLLRANYNG